uniref:Uncharacterized protein n=1 Tax=Panagrellus redivivus TaxID=6233 RepID=A0A7E4W8S9_PANRE
MTKLLAILLLIGSINAQRILYGLPPLPHDDSDDDLLAPPPPTPAPFKFHTFAPFTFPPLNHGPFQPLDQLRPFDINPIPELPPIPESRIDGTFDSDGNFVPRVKPEPQQVAENRIHGVKVEPHSPHPIPNLFHHPTPPTSTPRRPYSRARGISVVTVTPNIVRRPTQHVISSQNTDPEPQFDAPLPIQSGRTKNARQWQTTAVKLNNHQERIKSPDSIESIDKVDAPEGGIQFDDAAQNDFDRAVAASAEFENKKVHHGSSNSTETPARKEIVTTRLAVEPFGSEIHVPTPTVAPVTNPPGKVFHRPTKSGRIISNDRRGGPGASHGVFEYRPKQRTFQPEQVFVTRAPVARPRQIHNPTPPPPIFANIGPTTLPPQPINRAPEDANFLAEVEEYDWRLHYRQQALEAASKTPGFRSRPLLQNRAHADPRQPGNPNLDADYEDLEAIRIREHFTENPPQKNFQLGNGPETAASVDSDNKEVLVPFNSGSRSPISPARIDQVGSQPEPSFNRPSAQIPVTSPPGLAGLGFNPQNNGYLGGVTPHPLFNGLFNLFNFNGAQNGGGLNLFPGLGR